MVRTFTPEEANALLPQVRPRLVELRATWHDYAFAREQWEELQTLDPEGAETADWRGRADALGERVMRIVDDLRAMGVEVKDPTLGLIDFHAVRGDGSTVYLCYRDDEAAITHWHPLDTGFAGRRPLSDL